MPRKATFNAALAIEMFQNGNTYNEIATQLQTTSEAIRKTIKRKAPELLEDPLVNNKQEIVELFVSGFSYKEIASRFKSTPDAIRMIITRNVPEELEKKRQTRKIKSKQLFDPKDEEIHLPVIGALTVNDRKEMLNEKTWGLNLNEGMSDRAFFDWNRQSFISDKEDNRKYKFDKSRGKIQRDLCTLNL